MGEEKHGTAARRIQVEALLATCTDDEIIAQTGCTLLELLELRAIRATRVGPMPDLDIDDHLQAAQYLAARCGTAPGKGVGCGGDRPLCLSTAAQLSRFATDFRVLVEQRGKALHLANLLERQLRSA